ncbi:MAG: hypothetical protein R3F13_00340 [Prosthecobacter sp.]
MVAVLDKDEIPECGHEKGQRQHAVGDFIQAMMDESAPLHPHIAEQGAGVVLEQGMAGLDPARLRRDAPQCVETSQSHGEAQRLLPRGGGVRELKAFCVKSAHGCLGVSQTLLHAPVKLCGEHLRRLRVKAVAQALERGGVSPEGGGKKIIKQAGGCVAGAVLLQQRGQFIAVDHFRFGRGRERFRISRVPFQLAQQQAQPEGELTRLRRVSVAQLVVFAVNANLRRRAAVHLAACVLRLAADHDEAGRDEADDDDDGGGAQQEAAVAREIMRPRPPAVEKWSSLAHPRVSRPGFSTSPKASPTGRHRSPARGWRSPCLRSSGLPPSP